MDKNAKIPPSSNKFKQCNNFKKEIVRNVQVPVREAATKTVNLNLELGENMNDNISAGTDFAVNKDKQQAVTSSLRMKNIRKPIDKMQEDEVKRVNIPFGDKVYKGLIDIGVGDQGDFERQGSGVGNKQRRALVHKDPEPNLSDYFRPSHNSEYVFTFPPPRSIPQKEWNYDSATILRLIDQTHSPT